MSVLPQWDDPPLDAAQAAAARERISGVLAPLQMQFPEFVSPDVAVDATIQERFAAFHETNPHVYELLRDMALDLVHSGNDRVSIKMLMEVLRWTALRTNASDGYKLNNDFTSRYARLLTDTVPALRDVFELRKLKAS